MFSKICMIAMQLGILELLYFANALIICRKISGEKMIGQKH